MASLPPSLPISAPPMGAPTLPQALQPQAPLAAPAQFRGCSDGDTVSFSGRKPAPKFGHDGPHFGHEEPAFGKKAVKFGHEEPAFGKKAVKFGHEEPAFGKQ